MITIKIFIDFIGKKNFEIQSGEKGLQNRISTITVLDALDGPKWLKGGEFILTSTFMFDDNDDIFFNFVKELVSIKASGLGIKLNRFYKEIPQNIIDYANEQQFPLITVPHSIVWSDLITEFHELRLQKRIDERLYHVNPVYLSEILRVSHLGIKAILKKTSELLHYKIAILNGKQDIVYATDYNYFEELHNEIELDKIQDGYNTYKNNILLIKDFTNYQSLHNATHILVSNNDKSFNQESLNLLDYIINAPNIGTRMKKDKDSVYVRLMIDIIFNGVSQEVIHQYIQEIDIPSNIYCFIMSINQINGSNITTQIKDYVLEANSIKTFECFQFHRTVEDSYFFVYIESDYVNKQSLYNTLRMQFDKLYNENKQFNNISINIGDIYTDLSSMRESYFEAKLTNELGKFVWNEAKYLFYIDIAVFNTLVNIPSTTKYIGEIEMLLSYKDEFNFDIIKTLEVYLECMNYKQAALKLFLHENTMRYRIQRINDLLKLNLDNPMVSINLLIKIKLYSLMHLNQM